MNRLKSTFFREVEVKHSWLYWIFFVIFMVILLFGIVHIFKKCTMETERTFAIIMDDSPAHRGYRRILTYVYQVDGKQYEGKAEYRYSVKPIASVGDTCYVFYEVSNKEKSRIVRRHLWGYGDNPVVVKRK